MTFFKNHPRLRILFSAAVFIFVSILIWQWIQCGINPSAYSLSSFDKEMVTKVEAEFLFTLPENAFINYVTYTTGVGRGKLARCSVTGIFTSNEFMNEYVQFEIGSKITNAQSAFEINGFPKAQNGVDAVLEFTENYGQTTAIIQKGGLRDKSLFKKMQKISS